MKRKTWEDQRNLRCFFKSFVNISGVEVTNIHPLQQRSVKAVHDALVGDIRIKALVLFGSSVNLRCTIHSDLDFVVQLSNDYLNRETRNDVSEKIQEACDWNADVLWYDHIKDNPKLMKNVLKGVQIL